MATVNAVGNSLTGSTGSGAFVGATAPTLGAITATSIVFSPTTSGIIGTTTNDNAGAGKVGEYISGATLRGTPVALTTVTAANIISISLTAGDWMVFGNVAFQFGATTNTVLLAGGITTSSATLPSSDLRIDMPSPTLAGTVYQNDMAFNVKGYRALLSGTTTIYLVAYAEFSVSTVNGYGEIFARRMR